MILKERRKVVRDLAMQGEEGPLHLLRLHLRDRGLVETEDEVDLHLDRNTQNQSQNEVILDQEVEAEEEKAADEEDLHRQDEIDAHPGAFKLLFKHKIILLFN